MRTTALKAAVLGAALVIASCDEKKASEATAPTTTSAPTGSMATTGLTPSIGEAPKDHASRLKAIADAFAMHDPKKVSALFAEDAVVKVPGRPDVKGRTAIEKDAARTFALFSDAKLVFGRVFVKDKTTAAAEVVFTGTNTGEAPEMGIAKATNKQVGVLGMVAFNVGDDGLIKEERRYDDRATATGQLNPDPKNPVRAIIVAPPNGTDIIESQGTPDETKAVDAQNAYFAAFSAHKLEDAMKFVGDDIVYDDYTQGAPMRGAKAFKGLANGLLTAFPDIKETGTMVYGAGRFLIVEALVTGTHKGPLGPLKPTNKTIGVHLIGVNEFKEGKVVRSWVWSNGDEFMTELGMAPSGPAAASAVPGVTGRAAPPATAP